MTTRAMGWLRARLGLSSPDDGAERARPKAAHKASDAAPAARASAAHIQEIKGLLLIGLSLWLFVAMASYYAPPDDPQAVGRNWGGRVGYYYAMGAFAAAGNAGYFLCVIGLAWGVVLVARKEMKLPALRLLSALCFVLAIAFVVQLAVDPHGEVLSSAHSPYGPGGWFAARLTPVLIEKFGHPGLWILMPLVALVAFMLATEMAFYPALAAFGAWARERREQRGEGLFRALTQWTGRLVLGLWDFVRGAGIGDTARSLVEAEALTSAKDVKAAAPRSGGRRQHPIDEDNVIDDDDDVGVVLPLAKDEPHKAARTAEAAQDEDDELDPAVRLPREGGELDLDDDGDVSLGLGEDPEHEELPPEVAEKQKKFAERAIKVEQSGMIFEPPTPPVGDWKLPPIELLEAPERVNALDQADIENQARKLEHALASFRVEAHVVGSQVGPTVILFELEVSQGTRMNKVTQLSQEIAAALRAQSVRIIAPIPGKATIGIEVPNAHRRKVRMSELISQKSYDKKAYALPLFLGMDAEGQGIVEDLAKMPHLLIAGTTGSGKSVCINTILASFLMTRSPHDVQMILVDPKMVELQMFAKIPHLMLPTVTDMRQATAVINWIVEKMEGRYELFQHAGVKNIKGYNALSEDELKTRMGDNWNEERTPRHVPYIVLVIDEFADLMMQSKKEAEQAITRLAQKSRAVGIHVILATQRPSTDVITGVIKGNLPTRIAFQVASKVDSRVILDAQGAEKLLGGGDMLYNPPASARIKRVQGALVEDHELQSIVDFVCQDSAQSFNQELVQVATGTRAPGEGGESTGFEDALSDPMWDDAVRVILKSKRGSASLLQRALGVGYTRASRLLDMMGEAGIVSDHKGSKAREVLMTLEQWEEMHGKAPSSQGAEDE
ncbi:MAG: DNA translocase FtsK 4TM domain-containing protein [Planctomycetes bacterium]|nr:DNA translocase FtsK 4TM domain-containing protein [Planctomycetota bacterium]